MEAETLYRAVRSRDRRFEGRFVVAVKTTGIYCRPGCPAKTPLYKNTRYFRHPAAAESAGFRACARCRPDHAVWVGTSGTVKRALQLIDAGALGDDNVERLAERLGVGDRHLRRLFATHVGTSPLAVAQTRRAHFARQLIDETALPLAEIAFASGFGSVRRFNAAMRRAFGRTPTELRRRHVERAELLTLALPVRTPYAWEPLVEFLAGRAIPGVEVIDGGVYRRATHDGGVVEVRFAEDRLEARLRVPSARGLRDAVERIRRLFDVAADPLAIADALNRDRALAAAVRGCPGRRVPGGWDGLELACRAILGQQVSVTGATKLAGRLVAGWGTPLAATAIGDDTATGLTHVFPTAEALAVAGGDAIAKRVGMPRARGAAIAALARAVADGSLPLDGTLELDALVARLTALPGIGAWTAQYLAMRLGEPDAFPAGDLWLRRALDLDERALSARAEAWRPFRAYAALHLWQSEVFR